MKIETEVEVDAVSVPAHGPVKFFSLRPVQPVLKGITFITITSNDPETLKGAKRLKVTLEWDAK